MSLIAASHLPLIVPSASFCLAAASLPSATFCFAESRRGDYAVSAYINRCHAVVTTTYGTGSAFVVHEKVVVLLSSSWCSNSVTNNPFLSPMVFVVVVLVKTMYPPKTTTNKNKSNNSSANFLFCVEFRLCCESV